MKPINYCTCYFESEFGYILNNINDKIEEKNKIYINDYIKNENIYNDIKNSKILVCMFRKELIKYESNLKNKFMFRHKNVKYMTKWHKDWQDNFSDTEIKIGERFADAIINNIVLEFQHSYIEKDLVEKRKLNYINNNKELFWIIDCVNDNIIIKKFGNIYQIKFNSNNSWKYLNFVSQNYIFLDFYDSIDKINKIFKINPNSVKSNMIDVLSYHTKNEFIENLKNNSFNKLYDYDEIYQTTLYFNQRGAGSGKTFESVQLVQNDDLFANIKTFIYLTKAHTAANVIYNEFIQQYESKKLNKVNNFITKKYLKHYLFNFTVNDKKCEVIIGTIDSFMYAIGDGKNHIDNTNNFFTSIAKKIRSGNINLDNKFNKYGGVNIKLSKECLIIIDEAQDLEPYYIEAINTIMRSTYINVYVIGDKLQSLQLKNNTHTFLELETNELPNTKIIRNTGENIVRRFHNRHFINFVNEIIRFQDFNLPCITGICDINCKYIHKDIIPYNIFCSNQLQLTIKNEDNEMNKLIEYILLKMNYEISENNYLPNNFMFIFPILSNNQIANRLEVEIQDFWINKFNDENYKNILLKNDYWKNINFNKYIQFIYLHKSEENRPINLDISKNSSRILSIHAAKGNGCEVVFLLGLDEKSLKIFSKYNNTYLDAKDIIYESLLHVGLTRQKEKLYVGLSNINDKIGLRFKKYIDNETEIIPNLDSIKSTFRFSKINDCLNKNSELNLINTCINIKEIQNKILSNETEKELNIIDWGHHLIRYLVFKYYLIYNIHNSTKGKKNDADKSSQIIEIMRIFTEAKIINAKNPKEYYKILIKNKEDEFKKNMKSIPILEFENKNINYIKIINDITRHIQNKIKQGLKKNQLPNLCPYEIIILYYGIYAINNGVYSDINIANLYNITSYYDECSNEIDDIHEKDYNCLCKKYFSAGNNNITTTYSDIRKSITEFYKKTEQVNETFKNFTNLLNKEYEIDISNFHYNLMYPLTLNGNSDQFKIWNIYEIIANSNKYVLYFVIKASLNKLNLNETINNIIYNIYFLSNIKETINGYKEYSKKNIIICIFTLDSTEPILFSFDIDKEYMILINQNIKNYILEDLSQKHQILIKFNEYCKLNNICSYNKICEKKKIPKYILSIFENLKDNDFEDNELLNYLDKKLNLRINEFFNNEILYNSIINNHNKSAVIKLK